MKKNVFMSFGVLFSMFLFSQESNDSSVIIPTKDVYSVCGGGNNQSPV